MKRTLQTHDVRRGFTLVELMAVIIIIGILSSILIGALQSAEQRSKQARTKSLIMKMNNMLMARWDSYRTLRLPIASVTAADGKQYDAKDETQRFRQNVARRRMFALRELVRMEMPDRYEDLKFPPTVLVQPGSSGSNGKPKPVRPYLWNTYRRKIQLSQAASPLFRTISADAYLTKIAQDYESAECLYLIMTSGVDDSSMAVEHFKAGDAGDKDGDGMMEFRDAWGNPIEFLRWAPGFFSPMQPKYRYANGDPRYNVFHNTQPKDPDDPSYRISRWQLKIDKVGATNNTVVDRLIVIDQDDPFNAMRVGPTAEPVAGQRGNSTRWVPGMQTPEYGFLLMPLIYSPGRDYKGGLNTCRLQDGYNAVGHPLYGNLSPSDPYNKYEAPSSNGPRFRGESTNEGHEFDNIHNQELNS